MDCTEAKAKMESYASDRLDPAEKTALEQHIASCEGCRLEVELVRAMGSTPAKESTSDGDEWTIDRIFGAGAARAPETADTPAAEHDATAASAPEPPPVPPEPFERSGLEPEPPAAAPADASADPPADLPAAESGPVVPPEPSLDSIFEKVPTPPPPEPQSAEPSAVEAQPAEPSIAGADASEPTATRAEESPVEPAARPAVPAEAESSFSDLKLESIQDSSIAAPQPDPLENLDLKGAGARGVSSLHPALNAKQGEETAWEFEPADALPEGTPPEGSLFFAEEALTRQASSRKGRSTLLRTILWSVGGIVGLALLVVSIWIALGMQRPGRTPAQASIPRPVPPPADSSAAPAPPADATAEPQSEPQAPATDAMPTTPPTAEANPAGPAAGAVIEAGALRTASLGTGPAPTASSAKPPAPTAPTRPSRNEKSSAAASPTNSASPKREPAATKHATPPTPVVTPSERSVPLGGGSIDSEPDRTTSSAPSSPPSSPALAPPSREPAPRESAKKPATGETDASSVPERETATKPAPSTSAPAEPAPSPPAPPKVERPIDRLHLATVTATKNEDLDALRKMKDTWKDFVKSSVGPDRARGKREYADCLWEIQALTGKDSDKKDALLAYREFLLTAPAGGADSRTVARMRQLEDAMADSR